MIFTPAV